MVSARLLHYKITLFPFKWITMWENYGDYINIPFLIKFPFSHLSLWIHGFLFYSMGYKLLLSLFILMVKLPQICPMGWRAWQPSSILAWIIPWLSSSTEGAWRYSSHGRAESWLSDWACSPFKLTSVSFWYIHIGISALAFGWWIS